MAHQYKWVFDEVNAVRAKRGERQLTWAEFIAKEPKEVYREKLKVIDHVEPDKKKTIEQVTAYDNESFDDICKRYGV